MKHLSNTDQNSQKLENVPTPLNSGDAVNKSYVDSFKPDLISQIIYPMYISHRGSPRLYPEESMEGQRLAAEDGFPIEIDVRALSDGTLVACHDTTVNRTMDGIGSGNVSSKTPQDWRQARIKPAVAGGKSGTPIFFEKWLDEFGGKYLLVPELKDSAYAYVDDFIDAIKRRGLEKAVIAQSFDFNIVSQFAAAGLYSIYLFTTSPTETPSQIASAGIWGVSGNSSMTGTTVSNMKAQGLKVIMYTINTKADAYTAIATKGCDGIFSDDPAYASSILKQMTGDTFADGYGWPGIKFRRLEGSTSNTDGVDVNLQGNSLYIGPAPPSSGWTVAYITNVGTISVPFRVTMDIHLGAGTNQSNSYGFFLYKNNSDPEAEFVDAARTGQEGMTFVGRRNGQLQGWKYVSGAAAVSLGSSPTQTGSAQFAESGQQGMFTLDVVVTTTTVTVSSPQKGYSFSVSDGFNPTDMTLGVRGAPSTGTNFSNIRIERL